MKIWKYNLTFSRSVYLILAIILLSFSLVYAVRWGVKSARKLRAESYRHENNYNSLLLENRNLQNGFALTQILTKQQYEQIFSSRIDSLKRANRNREIKLNRIIQDLRAQVIWERENVKEYWTDSITPGTTIIAGRKILFNDSCMGGNIWYPADSSYALVSRWINLTVDAIIYEGKKSQQRKLFGIPLWRYGPREINARAFTNCGDSAKVFIRNIKILRE
jgi:hypothetical protein